LPAFSLAGCGSNSMGKSSTPSPVLATPPSSLTYETSALSATVGIPITPDPGAVSGGSSGLTFSVSPTLPPGWHWIPRRALCLEHRRQPLLWRTTRSRSPTQPVPPRRP
jgi:hypothetical protein